MRVKVHVGQNEIFHREVQEKLFEMGYKWESGHTNYLDYNVQYYILDMERQKISCGWPSMNLPTIDLVNGEQI